MTSLGFSPDYANGTKAAARESFGYGFLYAITLQNLAC